MIDLMIKMALCLVVALMLGFIIGWLLSKISLKKRYEKELEEIETKLFKSEDALKKLREINLMQKEDIHKEKAQNVGFIQELERKSQELKNTDKKLTLSKQSLLQKNIRLERLLEKNEKEIKGLERVLIKAEAMIEERDRKISRLEKRQQAERVDREYEELLITKDQFSHIESQLLEYQREIAHLTELNSRLKERCRVKLPVELELKQQEDENSELDDSTIVKLFGDTYKKIVKS